VGKGEGRSPLQRSHMYRDFREMVLREEIKKGVEQADQACFLPRPLMTLRRRVAAACLNSSRDCMTGI
jgi:hypothetical protein